MREGLDGAWAIALPYARAPQVDPIRKLIRTGPHGRAELASRKRVGTFV